MAVPVLTTEGFYENKRLYADNYWIRYFFCDMHSAAPRFFVASSNFYGSLIKTRWSIFLLGAFCKVQLRGMQVQIFSPGTSKWQDVAFRFSHLLTREIKLMIQKKIYYSLAIVGPPPVVNWYTRNTERLSLFETEIHFGSRKFSKVDSRKNTMMFF